VLGRPDTSSAVDDEIQDAVRLLTSKPEFRNITLADLLPILRTATRRTFANGATLMEHGRHSDSLHLMLKGRARIARTYGLERPKVLAEVGAGDLVGEMGSFSGVARSATVTAVGEVQTLELTERKLQRVLRHDHPLMVALVRVMNERYKAT